MLQVRECRFQRRPLDHVSGGGEVGENPEAPAPSFDARALIDFPGPGSPLQRVHARKQLPYAPLCFWEIFIDNQGQPIQDELAIDLLWRAFRSHGPSVNHSLPVSAQLSVSIDVVRQPNRHAFGQWVDAGNVARLL
eukprot:4555797-Pyramimonas_sp.AAC.1